MTIRCVLLIVGLAATAPAAAAGVDSLAPGTRVRLLTKSPESVRIAGTFVRRDEGRLVLNAGAAERAIPLASVERIDARTGNRGRRGALLGAFAGFAAATMVAHFAGDTSRLAGAVTLGRMLAWGVAGMAAGGIAGSMIPEWERVALD